MLTLLYDYITILIGLMLMLIMSSIMMVWIVISVLIDSTLTQVVVIDNALIVIVRNVGFVYIIVWVDYGAFVALHIDRNGNLYDDLLLYYLGFVLKVLLL